MHKEHQLNINLSFISKEWLQPKADEKCAFSGFYIIGTSEVQLRNILTISFNFLYPDALIYGDLLILEGLFVPGLANP